MAPDAPPCAPAPHHVPLVRRPRHARGRPRRACPRCARELVTVPRREPAKGSAQVPARCGRARRAPAAVRRRQVPLARSCRQRLDGPARDRRASTWSSATSWRPSRTCRRTCRVPSVLFTHNVEAEIWRRHAETARSPLRKALLSAQWRRMRAVRARRGAPFRPGARGLRHRPPHAAAGLRPAAAAGARRADRRGHARTSRRSPGRCGRATWSSPDRWTGCRTKTGCSTSSATSCRSSAARNRAPRCRSSAARRRRPS